MRIHRKIHSSNIASTIKYDRCEDNHSQITDHHRTPAQNSAIILSLEPREQPCEVSDNVKQKKKHMKRRRFIYGLLCVLCCLFFLIGLTALIIALLTKSKSTTTTTTTTTSRLASKFLNDFFELCL